MIILSWRGVILVIITYWHDEKSYVVTLSENRPLAGKIRLVFSKIVFQALKWPRYRFSFVLLFRDSFNDI